MKLSKRVFLVCIGALALAALLAFTLVPLTGGADVGDFNDYGGDSGGGWDSGNDWDSGDSGSDGWVIGGNVGNSSFTVSQVVGAVACCAVLVLVIVLVVKGKKSAPTAPPVAVRDHTQEILPAILQVDPNFAGDKFIAWAKEVYFTLSYAWMARDWNKVRPFEKEELYRQHEMQMQQYISSGRVNVLERININQAYLQKYVRDREYEYLTVFLQVRMIDYIKDEKTGQVLKGSPDADCHMQYLYTFMRKNGVKTDPASSGKSTTNCPNCGAPTHITSAGVCEYCDSVIVTGEFDWVLSNIDGVKPQTVIDDTGVILRD